MPKILLFRARAEQDQFLPARVNHSMSCVDVILSKNLNKTEYHYSIIIKWKPRSGTEERLVCIWYNSLLYFIALKILFVNICQRVHCFQIIPSWTCLSCNTNVMINWAAVSSQEAYHLLFIHVVDVCLRKMTLHTRRAPNNCGASGRASRTEIKQVLSHNPCLLKISLFRWGWRILGSILSSVAVEATAW